MRRGYSYVRFSTPEQLKGDSLRRQLKLSADYCQRKGLALDESLHLRDLGVSAFRGRNAREGKLAVFLEAVRLGKVPKGSVLIIESFDRLSRNQLAEAQNLIMQLLGAGITIVTLTPEREYPPSAANDLGAVIEILVILWRGHEESATKSKRLASVWEHKRETAPTVKVSARCPAWLRLLPGRKSFELRQGAVDTLRSIVRLVVDGMGIHSVVRKLNAEGVPTIGRTGRWNTGYLNRLFHNRALIGEYQPRSKLGRRPIGPPIPNYYPAVLTEAEWYALRGALEARREWRGRVGKNVASLFTGILRDARDGCPMIVITKGGEHRQQHLVSNGAKVGMPGSRYVFVAYEPVERAFLQLVKELKPSDVLPPPSGPGVREEIAAKEGRVAELAHKIGVVKKRAMAEEDSEELMDLLLQLEKQKKAEAEALERLKAEAATTEEEMLRETQSLIGLLDQAEGEERVALRRKVKARIRQLVSDIRALVVRREWKSHLAPRLCALQVWFADGRYRRDLLILTRPRAGWWARSFAATALPGDLDLRNKKDVRELEKALLAVDLEEAEAA